MSGLIDWAADLIYPNRCPSCDRFIPWDRLFCEECESAFEERSFCPKCGMNICVCESRELYYDGCAVAAPYVGEIRRGVLALKYHRGFNAAKYFAPRLCGLIDEYGFSCGADIITAVPMNRARRAQTGYNQAEYIARLISKRIFVPCDFKLLKKKPSSAIQHELSAEERMKAAAEAYLPYKNKSLAGKTVILCDDIITTGSTLSECAKILKSLGAKKVYCAVISGTVLDGADKNKGSGKNVGT